MQTEHLHTERVHGDRVIGSSHNTLRKRVAKDSLAGPSVLRNRSVVDGTHYVAFQQPSLHAVERMILRNDRVDRWVRTKWRNVNGVLVVLRERDCVVIQYQHRRKRQRLLTGPRANNSSIAQHLAQLLVNLDHLSLAIAYQFAIFLRKNHVRFEWKTNVDNFLDVRPRASAPHYYRGKVLETETKETFARRPLQAAKIDPIDLELVEAAPERTIGIDETPRRRVQICLECLDESLIEIEHNALVGERCWTMQLQVCGNVAPRAFGDRYRCPSRCRCHR